MRSVLLQEIQRAVDASHVTPVDVHEVESTCQHYLGHGKYCPHLAMFVVTSRNGELVCVVHVLDVLRNGAVRRQKGR